MHNIKEVAALAKTSTATVSRVINETGYVSSEVKQRVLKAVKELDYRPLKRDGKTNTKRTIALVVPDIENPFFAKLTKEISQISNTLMYNILLINVSGLKNDGGDFLLDLISSRVDGVIYTSSYRFLDVISRVKGNNIPIVVLDREIQDMEIDTIVVNNDHAAFLATEHLIQLGHKHIAFIGGTKNMEISINRHKGYKRALEKYKMAYDETIVKHGDFTMQSGYNATKGLMQSNGHMTGIVAANDLMAIGAFNYLNAVGYKIPTDMSIVGFDDIDLASSITPKLTTVSYPIKRMSQLAIESIIKHISGTNSACESVSLRSKLIIRDSTGAIDVKD
ncbi:LacI family DNA-binding transcriptional regulator [Vallitalea pronyensis]|uniref:LacI family DNA-binding transcriptional regulator n=1 Tax=Vallitalea pronyensis TaxID=1348613 RepID=A0A8J8MKI5_9FIRM|nr:LacI family DNA-binding transcriptional regulator [Vallitalea pronyensis]QUI23122.1 LacI family DNA-binding transcriptional regulator [Vallitalea pronyensis]